MENTNVLIDTSVIIDYIRAKQKEKSLLYILFKHDYDIFISSITTFEVLNGLNTQNAELIELIFKRINSISFDYNVAKYSSFIYNELKSKNQLIEIRDIFIAATAIFAKIPLATSNIKHFNRIEGLTLFEKSFES